MILGWTAVPRAGHHVPMWGGIAWALSWLFASPAQASKIEQVTVEGDRVTVTFDGTVAGASTFLVAGPDRIAVDVEGAEAGGRVAAGGAVRAVRQSRRDGAARVVLDLAQPMIIRRGRFTDDGRSLVLDLAAADSDRFARAARQRPVDYRAAAGVLAHRDRYSVSIPVPPAVKGVPLPAVQGDADRPLVVIDAGHGGHDPGAISSKDGTREKDVTLAIARATRDALLQTGRVRVALTRDGDRFLVLQERYRLARRMGASLFISIHADSAENDQAHGATAYTLSEVASDREAARLAARENRADVLAGVNLGQETADVSSILIDLTQRETMNASAQFARLLGREAAPRIPTRAQFHRMASLMVLKAPDMPSILFETGYLSNEEDVARLNSRDGRRAVAQSVASAVQIYFARQLASR